MKLCYQADKGCGSKICPHKIPHEEKESCSIPCINHTGMTNGNLLNFKEVCYDEQTTEEEALY